VVIGDFDIVRIAIRKDKAHTVLVIDPDTMLTLAVALERFQSVSRRHAQVIEFHSGIQHRQLTHGGTLNALGQLATTPGYPQVRRILVAKISDHVIL
jgi:hypothetical protein